MRHIACKSCHYDLTTLPGCTNADFVCPECGGVGTGRDYPFVRTGPKSASWLLGSIAAATVVELVAINAALRSVSDTPLTIGLFAAWAILTFGFWKAYSRRVSAWRRALDALAAIIGALVAVYLIAFAIMLVGFAVGVA